MDQELNKSQHATCNRYYFLSTWRPTNKHTHNSHITQQEDDIPLQMQGLPRSSTVEKVEQRLTGFSFCKAPKYQTYTRARTHKPRVHTSSRPAQNTAKEMNVSHVGAAGLAFEPVAPVRSRNCSCYCMGRPCWGFRARLIYTIHPNVLAVAALRF
jgi:hypothetical protein